MSRQVTVRPAFLIAAIGLAIGVSTADSPVTGNVQPIDAALHAWLYSATDTTSTNVNNTTGRFEFPNVKAGNYQLFIEGKPPYRNNTRDGIHVTDGQANDVGVIVMDK